MDHLQRLTKQVRNYVLIILLASNALIIFGWWVGIEVLHLHATVVLVTTMAAAIASGIAIAFISADYLTKPISLVWQAVLHVSPGHTGTLAPDVDKMGKLGRELVTSLSLQIYQLASSMSAVPANAPTSDGRAKTIMNSLPLPLFVIDKEQNIVFANEQAQKYLSMSAGDMEGKSIYSVLDLAFPTDDTFDVWLNQSREHLATASKNWEHVKTKQPDGKVLQFDMAAYYNKGNPSGIETLITLFDHTKTYAKDDEAISFVALAVHELRTPLTLLRGYIEVFQDELDGKLDEELSGFMNKMQVSAQQLATFVNNILNVARVEGDQMVLQLTEEKWAGIVQGAVDDIQLRAQIHNKTISYTVAENLPTVAVDRVSIYEVLSNLLDNAIKYSGDSNQIAVKSYLTKDGFIETTVQDWGVGIPESVLPNLFEKFYRNHRTQSQIGGTGLGLYLSKSIVEAHGGHIWIDSKEGQGATVGFTLQPYVMIAHKIKNSDNNDIVRNAHGWIKNHSLYRR